MSGYWVWIGLAVLIFIIWMRDEMSHAPMQKEDHISPPEPSHDDFPETDVSMPPQQPRVTEHDYSKDEEFCRKHPCDYMEPYRKPDGSLTYLCTNEVAWKRWGVEKEILQNLNDGVKEQCARCAGLPCIGQRKPDEDRHIQRHT